MALYFHIVYGMRSVINIDAVWMAVAQLLVLRSYVVDVFDVLYMLCYAIHGPPRIKAICAKIFSMEKGQIS